MHLEDTPEDQKDEGDVLMEQTLEALEDTTDMSMPEQMQQEEEQGEAAIQEGEIEQMPQEDPEEQAMQSKGIMSRGVM